MQWFRLKRHRANYEITCMTSFTKPKVHNIIIATPAAEDHATATTANSTKNLVKFGRVVFEICYRTDRQTHRSTLHLLRRRSNKTGLRNWMGE